MKKRVFFLKYIVLFLLFCDASDVLCGGNQRSNKVGGKLSSNFKITSKDFMDKGTIPVVNACEWLGGENRPPRLAWTSPPEKTERFALMMVDTGPEGHKRETKHWSVYNIPKHISDFSSGEEFKNNKEIVFGKNYQEQEGYTGPCPENKHLYKITLFALTKEMPIVEKGLSLSESEFVAAYGRYILSSASTEGYFQASSLRLFINKIKKTIYRLIN